MSPRSCIAHKLIHSKDTTYIPRKLKTNYDHTYTHKREFNSLQCGFKENKSFWLFENEEKKKSKFRRVTPSFVYEAKHTFAVEPLFFLLHFILCMENVFYFDGWMNEWMNAVRSLTHHFPVTQMIILKAKYQNWSAISNSHAPTSIVYVCTCIYHLMCNRCYSRILNVCVPWPNASSLCLIFWF